MKKALLILLMTLTAFTLFSCKEEPEEEFVPEEKTEYEEDTTSTNTNNKTEFEDEGVWEW